MLKLVKAIDNVLKFFYDWIAMISGTAVTLLIMAGAFMRYILKMDFYGSEEYILIAGYWLYFIGSMSAARSKTHINADMANLFIKDERKLEAFHVLRDILALAICCVAIKWCWDYWSWSFKLAPKTSVHKIPFYIQQAPMCASFLVWGLYLVRDTVVGILHVTGKKLGGEIE